MTKAMNQELSYEIWVSSTKFGFFVGVSRRRTRESILEHQVQAIQSTPLDVSFLIPLRQNEKRLHTTDPALTFRNSLTQS